MNHIDAYRQILKEGAEVSHWKKHLYHLHHAAEHATVHAHNTKNTSAMKHAHKLHDLAHMETAASESDAENHFSHYHNHMAQSHKARSSGDHSVADEHHAKANEHRQKAHDYAKSLAP